MRAAAVQMCSTPDVEGNLATADRLVREAAAGGADLVLLPEKWPCLGAVEAERDAAAEDPNPAVAWARAIARELGIDLLAGSISLDQPHGRRRNVALHVGPDGELRAEYAKVHLFDVEVDGRVYAESAEEDAGEELVVSAAADGTSLGLSVCYDLRFPELYRALTVRGARVLLVPAAFTLATTRAHWELLLRARAVEEQCFVIAANQAGAHREGLLSGGRSMIVDPWGEILAGAGETGEATVAADLDFARQDDVRARLPALAHRRPGVYDASVEA